MTTTHLPEKSILLVGAGPMAVDYVRVFKKMRAPFFVVGRSQKSAEYFAERTNIQPFLGGIDMWLRQNKNKPGRAVVAVAENELGKVTRSLIKAGVKLILVEKPGGFDVQDIRKTARLAKTERAGVFVGFNRRFYASVAKARELIKLDGGAKSLFFEFTERSYIVELLKRPPGVKENWFLQNSSHVIDMAFFMAGWPKQISAFRAGKLKWHPSGAIYTGAGITSNDALFTYHANWASAGRWGVEIMTAKNRFIFRPLEKLFIQKFGSMEIEEVPLRDKLDKEFKPGLYLEVKSFLTDKEDLPTIDEQVGHLKHYQAIGGPNV